MAIRNVILLSAAMTTLAMTAGPAVADDWGFSFGFTYNDGPRYYCAPRTYVYREYVPTVVYREYVPATVVYGPPRVTYFSTCVPRTTVVYRDCGPRYFRSSTTYVRSCRPGYRVYRQPGWSYRCYGSRPATQVRVHWR